MRSVKFVSGGKKYNVKSARIGTELWLHINGKTHVIDLRPKAAVKSATEAGAASGQILAPMPGKILKINFSLHDRVEAQKVIVVMEAMKMEYSLSAPFTGKVKEISCREGQQVELDQKLVLLESDGVSNERKN